MGYQKEGTVTGCTNTGAVTGTGESAANVGGVVGGVYTDSASPRITNCTNSGEVTGTDNVGGVVGRCYVDGSSWSVSITGCTNSGTVSGTSNVGGVLGSFKYAGSATGVKCTVTSCKNKGMVTGTSNVGGVLGYNEAGSCQLDGCRYLSTTAAAGVGTVAAGSSVEGKPEASADETQLNCTHTMENGRCETCGYQKVARVIVSETETDFEDYDSFAAALSAVAAGQTLRLLADVEAPTDGDDSKLDLIGKSGEVTIDLNGKTLSGAGNLTVVGNVTVTDSTSTPGTITGNVTVAEGGSLTVTGGRITSLTVNGGELTLDGTVLYHDTTITPTIDTLTVNSGEVTAKKCGTTNHTSAIVGSLVVKGGTVQLLDGIFGSVAVPYGMDCLDLLPRGGTSAGNYYAFTQKVNGSWNATNAGSTTLPVSDDGYYMVASTHRCTFNTNNGCTCGRRIEVERETAYYASLEDALNSQANDGKTLMLQQSITPMAVAKADGGYENVIDATNKTVTIDLNDKSINASKGDEAAQQYDLRIRGNVTITYGTVNTSTSGSVTVASGKTVIVDGNVTLEKGEIKNNVTVVEGGSLTVSGGSITGDVTVAEGGSLTVKGGSITGKVTVAEGKTIGSIFAEGYGCTIGNTWYDGNSEGTTLSNITVKKLPIQGRVVIKSTTKNVTYNIYNTDPVSYTYGDSETFTASVTLAEGYSTSAATYEWKNDGGDLPTTGCTANGNTLSVIFPSVTSYNFVCSVTVDGYTATTVYGGQRTVVKGTLTEGKDYTAPTASSLTYNAKEQQLVNQWGSQLPIGTQYQYSLDKANWKTDISDIKAKDAGTYTVYWKIDGGTNYQSVTDKTPVSVTIEPRDINPSALVVTPYIGFKSNDPLTFNGKKQTPVFELELCVRSESSLSGTVENTLLETLTEGKDYTVTVTPQTDAGEDYTATIVGKGNYTGTLTEKWSIEKAAAPKPDDVAAERPYSKTGDQSVSLKKVLADGNVTEYELGTLPAGVTDASVDEQGRLHFTIDGLTESDVDKTFTIPVTLRSQNYEDATVNVVVTVTKPSAVASLVQQVTGNAPHTGDSAMPVLYLVIAVVAIAAVVVIVVVRKKRK